MDRLDQVFARCFRTRVKWAKTWSSLAMKSFKYRRHVLDFFDFKRNAKRIIMMNIHREGLNNVKELMTSELFNGPTHVTWRYPFGHQNHFL